MEIFALPTGAKIRIIFIYKTLSLLITLYRYGFLSRIPPKGDAINTCGILYCQCKKITGCEQHRRPNMLSNSPEISLSFNSAAVEERIRSKAADLFLSANWHAKVNRLLAFFTRHSHRLPQLSENNDECSLRASHYAGEKVVEIEKIRGSESRGNDFDDESNPLTEKTRDRWLRIARAFLRNEALPPVELIQVDDTYYVRDGHHRVSVARSLGQAFIDAEVIAIQSRNLC